ncbi:uncharacterized protein BYT42DRAFT_577015 [Radiomyces spectabilis]|uniref:uncharacterized protein n=1 Tax=Radiomyces spectabilis TaxID=64574 RepID=UPI00221E7040|nr:uncharacterized protein BYT42DRAFT_577015 [Radiomyces spectabilis]KAI8374613.1 hypothetical protein BYT42DRAFT_577015 [Radiomyces spectabilis]
MSSSPSKSHAKYDQTVGDVKETVGNAVGNESLQAKGTAQHGSGQAEETAANISGYVQGLKNQVEGTAKGVYNAMMGNSGDEAGAKVEKKAGEAQKGVNS